ncbi:MAG: DUF6504 family protein [Phycisphaerae bacterium]
MSKPIIPGLGTDDISAAARGEPGLPARFTWRQREDIMTATLKAWKTSSGKVGTGRLYLRKHGYTMQNDVGLQMTLYCERQTRSRRNPKAQWWLCSVQRHARWARHPALPTSLRLGVHRTITQAISTLGGR